MADNSIINLDATGRHMDHTLNRQTGKNKKIGRVLVESGAKEKTLVYHSLTYQLKDQICQGLVLFL